MFSKSLVRGRDVTTALCGIWSVVFSSVGIATMMRAAPTTSFRMYGESVPVAIERALTSGDFSRLGLANGGYTLGMFELIAGGLLLMSMAIYLKTRRSDPNCDRMHIGFALFPLLFALGSSFYVLTLGQWQTGALFVFGYLGIAAAISLFIAPALMTVFGVPADRERILAAMRQHPIHMSNWHSARR